MWPFRNVNLIEETGFFNGFTDWHSHLLPGVDDGVRTMEETLAMLREYERLGARRVWLTPHIMEDYPNTTAALREKFEELRRAWHGDVEIRLGSENMLDTVFTERLESDDFLTIGDDGRHLLVETSYFSPPMGMTQILESVMAKGYKVVLAHPERYRYMERDDYCRLKEMGVILQMNYMSLTGKYGEDARKKSEWLLGEEMYGLCGGDFHRLEALRSALSAPLKDKVMKRLTALAHSQELT